MTSVRWGFLGAGSVASSALAPAMQAADGAVLVAAAAQDQRRAAELAGLTGSAYGAYGQMLADPDVDAVYISLANDAHFRWCREALRAGKAVLCEKPLALTAEQVDGLTAEAAQAGRPLVEASTYRWHPRVRLAQRLLCDGVVGTVEHVAAGFSFPGPPRGNFRWHKENGGGALYDVGCYAVSAALWACRGAAVREVVARQQTADTGVDVLTELLLEFDGGAEAEIRVSMAEPARQWLIITGNKGEIELRDEPFTSRNEPTELWVSDGRGTERMPVPAADPFRLMVEDVSRAIRGGEGYLLPLAESRTTAAVIDAAFASAAAGQPISPPAPA